jgi:hypothetical protein
VFQQGDPRTYLADIPVQMKRAVRDASSAAGGSVLCAPVVRKGSNLALAKVREDVKDHGSEREYVRCLGVCLSGLPSLYHGGFQSRAWESGGVEDRRSGAT